MIDGDGIYKPRVSNIEDLDNPTILQTLEAMKKYVVEHAVPGAPGTPGANGAAATVQVGQVTTLPAGSQATVTNSGTNQAAVLNFGIPQGATGATGADGTDGAAATIQIGEVVTGAAGTNASVENTGTENAAILKFTIPRGATGTPGQDGANGAPGAPGADGKDGVTFTPSVDTNGDLSWSNDGGLPNPETVNLRGAQGEAATVQVGQVTTLPAGSQATVTNSGTNQAAVLNFGIPQGADALENGGIVEQNKAPLKGMIIQLTALNRDPIRNEKIELTYRDTNTGKIYGVLCNFPDGGYASLAPAYVVDFWQISGENGTNGVGVPAGGTMGQVLKKKSNTDYDTEWVNESGGSGGTEIVDLGAINITPDKNSVKLSISEDTYHKLTATTPPIIRFTVLTAIDSVSNFEVELPRIRRGGTGTPSAYLCDAIFGAADTSVMYNFVKNYYWRVLVVSESTGYEVDISCVEWQFAQPH